MIAFSRKEIRTTAAREIRAIRARRFLYLQEASCARDYGAHTLYMNSASACSASIDGIQSLIRRLGLVKGRKRDENNQA